MRTQPIWNLFGFGCSGDTPNVPSVELWCQGMFDFFTSFLRSLLIVGLQRALWICLVLLPIVSGVNRCLEDRLRASWQTSEAEVLQSLLFNNFVLSGRKHFLYCNPNFPSCNCQPITSLYCTQTADRRRTFQHSQTFCIWPLWGSPFFPHPSWSFQ